MENYSGDRRCLICCRPSLEKLSIHFDKLISNATILQDFLTCFHISVLDSKVDDLSTSCQFCPTCQQFITEWSSIQSQMTQLTRRAAQLKATLSALLLSAPQSEEQNQTKDAAVINSREAELPLPQKIVDDIRKGLHRKYLVDVIVDKIQLPRLPRKLNQEEFPPLSLRSDNYDKPMDDRSGSDESDEVHLANEDQLNDVETSEQNLGKYSDHGLSDKSSLPPVLKLGALPFDYDKIHEPSDHWECVANIQLPVIPKIEPLSGGHDNDDEQRDPLECGAHDSEEEYLPSEDGFNDVESPEQFLEMRPKREVDGNYHDFSHDSVASMEMSVKAATSKTNGGPKRKRNRTNYTTTIIPIGPNRFKYNGYDIRLNDEDQCYYCGVCNFNCGCKINTVLGHIRDNHYTAEDKIRFTAVKTGDTEWLYGGKYKITQVNENRLMCASCGDIKCSLQRVVTHIRSQHVELEDADEVVPVTDTPSVNDLNSIEEELESVPYTFDPADNKFTCGFCGIQVSTFSDLSSHIRQSHSEPPRRVLRGICGVETAIEKADGEHNNMKRQEALPLKCPTCFKQFLSKWTFKRHMAVHELGEEAKKYTCEMCGKRFLTLQHCKEHERIHTGEKPYECQICGQKFSSSSHLTRHRKSAHGIRPGSRRVVKVSK